MQTLKSIAGKNGCGGNFSLGKKGCQIPFGTPKHAIRLKKGTVIPSTTNFNLEYLRTLIISGIATPLIGSSGFERLSGEDAVSTTTDTVERLNVLGLPKYKLMYQEGHEFYRQMSGLTGFKNSDWIIIDDSGRMKIAINSNGDFVGFTAGQVIAEMVTEKVQGGDGESKSVTIQFINRLQWDKNYTIATNEQLGFDWEELEGLNPVSLSFVSVPVSGDTTIQFKAVLSSDENTYVEGLAVENISINYDNRDEEAIDTFSYDSENKVYSAICSAVSSGQKVNITFKNGINSFPFIDLGGVLYSTKEETIEVAPSQVL